MLNTNLSIRFALIICGILSFTVDLTAQKINRSQLQLSTEEGTAYFGKLRILLLCDTIQLALTEIEGDIVDSYYDEKSFLLITVDKYGIYTMNGGEKKSGKWVHDLYSHSLNPDASGICRVEVIGLQIIDSVTVLVQFKFRGMCFRKRKNPHNYSLVGIDDDEPGNPKGLKTSILRICKDGIREYSYEGRQSLIFKRNIDPNSNRPDK